MSNIFAVDAGFAQTKWYLGDKQGKFPSAVAEPAVIVSSDLGEGAKRYTIDGETLVVGLDALRRTVSQDYKRDTDWLLKRIPFLVAKAADEARVNLANVDVLALGLPITGYRANVAKIVQIMSNIEINGIRYSQTVSMLPQGVGALFAYALESSAARPDDEGLVVDVGGNTCLVVSHRGYHVEPEGTKQYDQMGISVAAEALSAKLFELTGGTQYSIVESLEILRTRVVKSKGQRLDVSNEVDKVLSAHSQKLIKTILDTHGKILETSDHILLAGGGADLLKQHLPDEWKGMALVMQDSEFANARGYFKNALQA